MCIGWTELLEPIMNSLAYIYTSMKKTITKIERKVGMEYQKAYKQG